MKNKLVVEAGAVSVAVVGNLVEAGVGAVHMEVMEMGVGVGVAAVRVVGERVVGERAVGERAVGERAVEVVVNLRVGVVAAMEKVEGEEAESTLVEGAEVESALVAGVKILEVAERVEVTVE